jgi:DUF4097 and DUF4098 domain-containing protein YvlB
MSEGSVDVLDRRTKIAPLRPYLIWLTAIGLLTGCKGGIDQTLEQTIEESHNLAPNGTLSIRNEDGSIHLYGSDAPEVELRATKRAYSAERLNGIKVQVSAHAGSVSIETIFPRKRKWSLSDRSGTVDYEVIFPQNATIRNLELVNGEISIDGLREGSARASLVNGRMSARNCFGNLDYQVVNGGIDFYYNWWEESTYLVKAAISNGAVGVFLPGHASFRVAAETQGGSIMSNFIEGGQRSHGRTKRLATTIGSEPEPTFQIKVTNGNIRIQGY